MQDLFWRRADPASSQAVTREGPQFFAMNQKRPCRGSLEGRTASISTPIYSFEASLNLPNSSHILVNPVVRAFDA